MLDLHQRRIVISNQKRHVVMLDGRVRPVRPKDVPEPLQTVIMHLARVVQKLVAQLVLVVRSNQQPDHYLGILKPCVLERRGKIFGHMRVTHELMLGLVEESKADEEDATLLDRRVFDREACLEHLLEGLGDDVLAESAVGISGRSPVVPSVKRNEHEGVKRGGPEQGVVVSQGEGRALLPLFGVQLAERLFKFLEIDHSEFARALGG